jgi:hypothetical protein
MEEEEEEEEVYYIELYFPDIFIYLIRTFAKFCGILRF